MPGDAVGEIEPTDEDLQELSREAFAGVASLRVIAQQQMRTRIAALRVEALARVAELRRAYLSAVTATEVP